MRNDRMNAHTIPGRLAARIVLLLVLGTASIAQGAELKFRPASGIEPLVGHYLVTLAPSVAADAEVAAESLVDAYGGEREIYTSSEARTFAVTMLPPRLRRWPHGIWFRSPVRTPRAGPISTTVPATSSPSGTTPSPTMRWSGCATPPYRGTSRSIPTTSMATASPPPASVRL
jgi:hypothetical protein